MKTNKELQLILNVKKLNDRNSYIELLDKYEGMINNMAYYFLRNYFGMSWEFKDFQNSLMYYFYEIIIDYQIGILPFAGYAKTFLHYKMSNYLKSERTIKNKTHFYTYNNFNEEFYISTYLNTSDNILDEIGESVVLSKYEHEIYEKYINGYSVKEISKELNKSNDAIYSAIDRIKKKIKSLL